jgi:photosystem II stability/assembly factor-like uncharacterized protein
VRDANRIVSRIAGSVIVALVLTVAPSRPALASGLPAMSRTSPTLTRILDLSFVDAWHGWVLGASCTVSGDRCVLVLRGTTDGGRTWQSLPTPRPPVASRVAVGRNGFTSGFLRFITPEDGWAAAWTIGRDGQTLSYSLFVTHNGGLAWSGERGLGQIMAIVPRGDTVWALTGSCPPDPAAPPCPHTLLASANRGRTWRTLPRQPQLFGDVHIVRASLQDAWVLSSIQMHSVLSVSHDGGRTWKTLTDPCISHSHAAFYEDFAALDTQQLWQVCGGQPYSWALGEKYLYASSDGGQHWTPLASSHPPGNKEPFPGTFPATGGGAHNLILTTKQRAWIILGNYWLFETRDGGRTWTQPIPQQRLNPGVDNLGPLLFVDTHHGWVALQPDRLFRTVDGGDHWDEVTLR